MKKFNLDEISRSCESVREARVTCAQGYFLGNVGCFKCKAGSFSLGGRATACTACSAGFSSKGGASACTACKAGTYSSDPGTVCSECPTGLYSTTGSSSCKACTDGKYSPDGINCDDSCPAGEERKGADCMQCKPGSFKSILGTGRCQSCGSKSFAKDHGATKCQTCPEGYYYTGTECVKGLGCSAGSFDNGSQCEQCPAGYFSGDFATACTACKPGTFSRSIGATGCRKCKGNSVSTAKGAIECSTCGQGFEANVDKTKCILFCQLGEYAKDGATCTSCPIGTYANKVGLKECIRCSQNTTTLSEGAKNQSDCKTDEDVRGHCQQVVNATQGLDLAGMEARRIDLIRCPDDFKDMLAKLIDAKKYSLGINCPPGSYSADGSCKVCPEGSYSANLGSITCSPCERGMTSAQGSTRADACKYSRLAKAAAGTVVGAALVGSAHMFPRAKQAPRQVEKTVAAKGDNTFTIALLALAAVSVIALVIVYVVRSA